MDKKSVEKFLQKKTDDLYKLNAQYRGEIINNAINTETYLEMIISYYFTHGNDKKAKELRHCLISTNMFSSNSKKNMFLFILKKKFPKYKLGSEDFDRIMAIRNQMAHGKQVFFTDTIVDELIQFDNNNITLHEWKTTKNAVDSKTLKLNREVVDKEISHIQSVNNKLLELLKLIKSEYPKKKGKQTSIV